MRHKPKYNDIKLVYKSVSGFESVFYANDVTKNKSINNLIGQPFKDSGSRYITDSDIIFEINGTIVEAPGADEKRIIGVPEIKTKGNNRRRGYYRADKVIVTT